MVGMIAGLSFDYTFVETFFSLSHSKTMTKIMNDKTLESRLICIYSELMSEIITPDFASG